MATNQQRREAAKRKLERQLARRAERAKRRKIIGVGVTVGAVVVVAGLVVFFATRNSDDNANAAKPDQASPSSETPPPPSPAAIPTQRAAEVKRPQPLPNPSTCDYPASQGEKSAKTAKAPQAGPTPATGKVNAVMKTTAGDIPVTLDRALAPCTVNSFVSLAKQGFYTDTACHRLGVSEGLQMLQCGDPNGDGSGGPGYTVKDENFPELQGKYGRGQLAMAKTSAPNSGGSQFFMVFGAAQLKPDYTVFGEISDAGLQVLDKVAKDGIAPGGVGQDGSTGKPKTEVKFTGITVG